MGIHLDLPRNQAGVCQLLITCLGGPGTGKTTLLAALSKHVGPPPRTKIVSPIGALKERCPELEWYRIHASDPESVEKFFRPFVPTKAVDSPPTPTFLLCDEFDELCTQQGYVTPAVYDFINYGRNFGHGAAICARGSSDISSNMVRNSRIVFLAQLDEPNALRYLKDLLYDPAHPDIDYQEIIKVLPSNPKDGYVFLCWVPRATPKFQGYVHVVDGEIREWTPEQMGEPLEDEASTTAEGSDTDSDSTGSTAGGTAERSPTGTVPGTAPTAIGRSGGSGPGSLPPGNAPG